MITPTQQHERGFSLIEILFTMVILTVLLVLGLSTFNAVRWRALKAQSMSNLRQIGVALNLYLAENNNVLMPRAGVSSKPNRERYWTAILFNQGYLTDKRVFFDPRFPPYSADRSQYAKRFEDSIQDSYGMRDWVKPNQTVSAANLQAPKPISIIGKPAEFFIVADSIWMSWGTQGYGLNPTDHNQRVRLDDRGKAAALFLDGHVEEMPGSYFENLGQTQGEFSNNMGYYVWRPE